MKITQTNGNSQNGIKGSRISVYSDAGELIDRFVVPSRNAQAYCDRHDTGRYARRFQQAKYVAAVTDMSDRQGAQ